MERHEADLLKLISNLNIVEMDVTDIKESNDTIPDVSPHIAIDKSGDTNKEPCHSTNQMKGLYSDKAVATTSQNLDTIYEEEPDHVTNEVMTIMSVRKMSRLLQMGNQYTKEKIIKRKAKLKRRSCPNKSYMSMKTISMHLLKKTLKATDSDYNHSP